MTDIPTTLGIAHRTGTLWRISVVSCPFCGRAHVSRHAAGRGEEPALGDHSWIAECDGGEYVLSPIVVVTEPVKEEDLPDVFAQYASSVAGK